MFRKSNDTFIIAIIFVVAAILLNHFNFWQVLGLTQPRGFIFQGILFLVLVTILHHSLFDPYLAIADERHEQTFEKRKRADEKKIQAGEMLKSYERSILAARMDALKQKEKIGIEAENEERRLLDAAKVKSQGNLDVAMIEIHGQVEKAKQDLQQSTTALVQQLVEEILSNKNSKKESSKSKTLETRI